MSLLLKLVALFSFFIFCKENYKSQNTRQEITSPKSKTNDTLVWKSTLKENVNDLVQNRNYNIIEDSLFGDCIKSYISSQSKSKDVTKKDIVENFDNFFDKDFKTDFTTVFNSEDDGMIAWYRRKNQEPISIKNTVGDLYCSITIPVKDSENQFSKIYWFHQINDKWYFCGLTCAG